METISRNSYTYFRKYLFGDLEASEEGYTDYYIRSPRISKQELVKYLIQLFDNYETDMAHYSDSQIAEGIKYIFDSSYSDWVFALRQGPAPLEDRLQAILGLKNIFSQCFEKRCVPNLANCNEEGNPLNDICYMLWENTPLTNCKYLRDKEALYQAIAEVMEFSLKLDNKACIESGLHGLGHLVSFYPKASRLIERNIRRFRKIDPRLRSYAKYAMKGQIW